MLEHLEARRLMSRNLAFVPGDPFAGGDPGIIIPGSDSGASMGVMNTGDEAVTASFYVQYRLVPVPDRASGTTADFYSPGAIDLAHVLTTEDIGHGGAFFYRNLLHIGFKHPDTIPTGWYAWMVFLDSTNVIPETNESDNYIVRVTGFATPEGIIAVEGTDAADNIEIRSVGNDVAVTVNGVSTAYPPPQGFDVHGKGGDDVIVASSGAPLLYADGGDGNDRIVGSAGNDFLVGGAGKDVIYGGFGNDRLNGNGGNDKLLGEAGADRIYGYAGRDYLDGGSSGDRLDGGAGADTLLGQSGNDRFFTADGEIDQLFGASGNDTAQRDIDDLVSSVEVLTLLS